MLDKIILGTAQLGMKYGVNNYGRLNKKEVFEILDYALDNSVNCFDTAELYGDSIELIGSYIKARPERKLNIISKLDPNEKIDSDNIKAHIQNKLNVLNLDLFHGYMFHSYNNFKHNNKLYNKFKELKKVGLIKNIGISLYEISDINDVVNNYNFDFIQLPFNLLDNEKEKIKILKTAKEKQIEIHVRSIFLQGLFFKPFPNFDKKLNPLKKYIEQLKEISVKSNTDIESLALKYPLEKDYIDKVIFGVHNIEQFSKNINTVNSNIKLPIDDIENINVEEKELLKPYNWI